MLTLFLCGLQIGAGRVARKAALDGERAAAKRVKRGGACLLAHGFSSSDAFRATHRGFGRCSWKADLA